MTAPTADRPGASADAPMPVRIAARHVRQYVDRLGQIWVEGQVAQVRERRSMAWLTLRDPDTDLSIPVMTSIGALRAAGISDGHRVVAQVKLSYFDRDGSLTWRAAQFRAVGEGALLQQLDRLRRLLTQEGLFADHHKRPLPLVPTKIGLICGTNSAAQRDVEVNARKQWPTVSFEVRQVTVQGGNAVAEVIAALQSLDSAPDIDVIVITRGGGSFVDLLPFSNESLLRAVFDARTPIVSAIGHEEDNPLLDLVADHRASTPTEAGKVIVPDLIDETRFVRTARGALRTAIGDRIGRERLAVHNLQRRPVMRGPGHLLSEQRNGISERLSRSRRALRRQLEAERRTLQGLTGRPVLARPRRTIVEARSQVDAVRQDLRRAVAAELRAARQDVRRDMARLAALSPQATLDRGYAVVRTATGNLVTHPGAVTPGESLDIRVSGGSVAAVVRGPQQADVPRPLNQTPPNPATGAP